MEMTTTSTPKISLLTIKKAAKAIDGLTPYRVRRMIADGLLPCKKFGNKHMISKKDLLVFFGI